MPRKPRPTGIRRETSLVIHPGCGDEDSDGRDRSMELPLPLLISPLVFPSVSQLNPSKFLLSEPPLTPSLSHPPTPPIRASQPDQQPANAIPEPAIPAIPGTPRSPVPPLCTNKLIALGP